MAKTIAFTGCSLLIAAIVICWIAGVAPFGVVRQGPASRTGKIGASPTPPAASEDNISLYLSPNGGCTEAIVREIGKASDCVYVQAAQFTSTPIARGAGFRARARG